MKKQIYFFAVNQTGHGNWNIEIKVLNGPTLTAHTTHAPLIDDIRDDDYQTSHKAKIEACEMVLNENDVTFEEIELI
jgi:type II secretory pathway predicted ATPase ExeA